MGTTEVACGNIYAKPVGVRKVGFYNEDASVGKAVLLVEVASEVASDAIFQLHLRAAPRATARNLAAIDEGYFLIGDDTAVLSFETRDCVEGVDCPLLCGSGYHVNHAGDACV